MSLTLGTGAGAAFGCAEEADADPGGGNELIEAEGNGSETEE
jgi:hypothetical protein